jgi:alpha-methylacyl-CoA racemase
MGILAALLEARQSGRGQVVDAAIVDGVTSLSAMIHWLRADGHWTLGREANMLDGGAHFYRCYTCADGKAISIGSVEPQFYHLLLDKLGVTDAEFERQQDAAAWPQLASRLEALFRTRTRDEWCNLLEGTDACFAPVLDYDEAPHHPHNKARGNHIVTDGTIQPAPAPRFSRTPGAIQGPPPAAGEAGQEMLDRWLLENAPA